MPLASGFIPPCVPTRAAKPPAGPDWVHEIKHDGYRLQLRRVGDEVRLFTRRGYDWTGRYPSIAVTARLLRARSFTLDDEAVVCGPDGVAIFDALHRRGTVSEAMLYAFDLLLDGEDLRGLPLADGKKRLARLLGGRRRGIVLSDHTADDGDTIFRHTCMMGPEGTRVLRDGSASGSSRKRRAPISERACISRLSSTAVATRRCNAGWRYQIAGRISLANWRHSSAIMRLRQERSFEQCNQTRFPRQG
jgi:bifunctional non-homologous end joining protein LigD